jgi:paraquat-inducible protein A
MIPSAVREQLSPRWGNTEPAHKTNILALVNTRSYPHLILCEGCDQVYRKQTLAPGERAKCRRCGTLVRKGRHFSISTWLALTLTAAALFAFANVFPVVIISFGGLQSEATIWQSVFALDYGPALPVAVVAGLIAIGIPAVQIVTLLWILSFAARGRSCPQYVAAMRVLRASKPWGMVEVCLLAILVAVVKLSGFLHVVAGVGVLATLLLAPLMAVITNRDTEDLWLIWETR